MQPFLRVLAHRLQQPVALAPGVHHDERLFDQGDQEVDGAGFARVAAVAHGSCSLQRPAAREHRQALQKGALGSRQQVVAPVDRGAQRLVVRHGGRVALGEQAEALVQSRGDLVHRKRIHARRRELDGERDAVETPADVRDGRGVAAIHVERVLRPARAVDEEAHRLRSRKPLEIEGRRRIPVRSIEPIGDGERRHRVGRLARHAKALAAGGEDAQRPARLQQPLGELRARPRQVLAVVQDEQQPAVRHMSFERLGKRSPGGFLDPEHRGHGLRHQPLVGERCELHEPHAIGVVDERDGRHLEGQAGLAGAARAGERHEPRGAQEPRDLFQLALASDETVERRGQVVVALARRGRGTGVVVELDGEPVAAARNGGEGLRAEELSQCRYLHLEVVLLDDDSGPDELEQLVLGDDPVAALDERQQQIEGAGADGRGLPADEYPAFGWTDFDLTEAVALWQVPSLGDPSSLRIGASGTDGPILTSRRFQDI